MSDDSELWKEYRKDQQDRRQARLPARVAGILFLRQRGLKVEQKTEYHFRIEGYLDVWPTHNRYHNLRTGKRGGYKSIYDLVKKER